MSFGQCIAVGFEIQVRRRPTCVDALRFFSPTDNPVTPIQPLQYVETAVTRVNYYDHKVLGPEQCVSVQEWVFSN